MNRRNAALAILIPGIFLACGSATGTGDEHGGHDLGPIPGDLVEADVADAGGNGDPAPVDPGSLYDDAPLADDMDIDALDNGALDAGLDKGSDSVGDATPDTPTSPSFCRRVDGCGPGEVCNLSTGGCERRASSLSSEPEIYTFQPHVAAPGDHIVIDGQGFYSGLAGAFAVKVYIGGKPAGSGSGMETDENRIVLT
ncbi:MAG: hypothetical protein GXP54_08300, partial [Deltaproteobacteria bacterium]|nr:hypothetical protein [Deltaproteobacteria bacterium]